VPKQRRVYFIDYGFRAGDSHSFRTAEECIEEAFKDIRTRTSLLEARYVTGDMKLYNKFKTKCIL